MITSQFPPLEGEHLYSWLVRLYRLSGFPEFMSFQNSLGLNSNIFRSTELFGDALKGCVDLFTENKRNKLLDHSPISIWQLSVPKLFIGNFNDTQQMLAKELHRNEQQKFDFDTSWQSCSICRVENMREYGTTYWHAEHQLPSVFKCIKHSVILDYADTPIKNLLTAVLPHDVEKWSKSVVLPPLALDKWQAFYVSVYRGCKADSQYAVQLRNELEKRLDLPTKSIAARKRICQELNASFENAVGHDVLRYLFKAYAKPNQRNSKNILIKFLANQYKATGVGHPVYWIAIAYWLKDDLNVNFGTYDETAGTTVL